MTTTRPTTTGPGTQPPPAAKPLSETEALRADLEMTRRHLAQTVQELTRQLNLPRRIKESTSHAGHRAKETASEMTHRAKESASGMTHRAKEKAGALGVRARRTTGGRTAADPAGHPPHHAKSLNTRAKDLPAKMRHMPAKVREMPAMSRRHPKATAAVGGAVALGAVAWIAGRNR